MEIGGKQIRSSLPIAKKYLLERNIPSGNNSIGRGFPRFYDPKGRLKVLENKRFKQVQTESNSVQTCMSDLEKDLLLSKVSHQLSQYT